jgi:hypothetical protein
MFDEYESDLTLDFDTAAAPPPDDYTPISDGTYQSIISKAEIKPTRDETGKRLVVHFRVTGPTHAGRVIIRGFNVINKNPKAQEISRRELAQLLAAVDLVGERDMGQLVEKECDIAVVIKPAQGEYAASNDVKRFLPPSDVAPAPAKGATPAKKAPAFMR